MRTRYVRHSQIIGLAALASLVIVGCQAVPGSSPFTPVRPTEIPPAPTALASAAAPDSVSTLASTPRPVRTALEATDPTTVNLAVGRPTFVEFFAFW